MEPQPPPACDFCYLRQGINDPGTGRSGSADDHERVPIVLHVRVEALHQCCGFKGMIEGIALFELASHLRWRDMRKHR